jgi:DNA-binding XRE family transcriptional regulator
VGRQTINAIEGDKYPPSLEVAFRIANILCTSLENVFFYEPDFEGDDEFGAGLVIEVPLDGDDKDGGN